MSGVISGWHVVGCNRCDGLWLLEAWKHGYNSRATCPNCLKEHQTRRLDTLAEHEEQDGAAELRARMLAARAGEDDAYQEEPAYEIQGEIVDEQIEAKRSADHLDLTAHRERFGGLLDLDEWYEQQYGALEDDALDAFSDHREAFGEAAGDEHPHANFYDDEAEAFLERDRPLWGDEDAETAEEAPSFDGEPRVSVRRTDFHDADVRVSDPQTGPRAHQALLDAGLDELLIEALGELPGEQTGYADHLREEVGATALHGHFADVAGKAAAAITAARLEGVDVAPDGIEDREQLPSTIVGDDTEDDPVEKLLELAHSLGSGMSSTGFPTSTEDVEAGTPPIFAAARSEPTVAVEFTGAFFERERSQREDVLDLLLALGHGCEVVLVPRRVAAKRLYTQHRDRLPTGVTERLDPQRPPSPHVTEGRPKTVEERISEAKDVLDPDGSKARVLRALRDSDAHALTYEDLRDELGLEDSHPRVIASRLADHGLVERIDRPDGTTALSLLAAGEGLLDDWRRLYGEQAALSDDYDDRPSEADAGSPSGADRYASPKNHLPCRVTPPGDGETTPKPPGSAAPAAAEPDRTERYAHGSVDINWMDPDREAAVLGSARSGEVSLINAELHREVDRSGDGRAPALGYDERRDAVVVGAEYHGPLQWWASIARALASPMVWRKVLTVDRVGEELEELLTSDTKKLRQGECIGWLPNDAAEDYDELADQFRDAYYELGEETKPLKSGEYEDRDDCRGEILSMAQGLAGSMSDLLKLAGVDVVREVRIPRFSDDFSAGGHAHRRRDLCRSIAFGAAIASSYEHCNAYRQLLEDREDKIDQAIEPTVDADDPIATMHGSFVIAGNGVEDLDRELRSALENPKELRDDAPEIATKIPVRTGFSPTTTRRTVKKIARQKNLEPGHREITAFHGFANDPYAAAEAIAKGLAKEEHPREMHLDEVRTALASLRPVQDADRETFARDRLLRGSTKAPRSGVRALLRANEPISQAEIARRGGCSTQSWRNHRDELQAAGLVEETPEGWRLTLPFHSERYEDETDVAEPWILDPDDRFCWSEARVDDVVEEIAAAIGALSDPIVNELLTEPYMDNGPPYSEVLESIGAGLLVRFVDATFHSEPEPPAALLGPDLKQLSIRDLQGVTDPPKISYGAD